MFVSGDFDGKKIMDKFSCLKNFSREIYRTKASDDR